MNLPVADVEAAIPYYEKRLGFRVVSRHDLPHKSVLLARDQVQIGLAENGGGADIGPIVREGVIGASLDVDGTHYFDIHHTPADTLDKIDPQDLALCVATMAVMAYTVADMPNSLSDAAPAGR